MPMAKTIGSNAVTILFCAFSGFSDLAILIIGFSFP
jgi:hypothetical protein